MITALLLAAAMQTGGYIPETLGSGGGPPPSGTCGGSPDVSEVVVASNWGNASCSSGPFTAYTFEADTGDFPDALVMNYNTPPVGDVFELNNSRDVGPADDCVMHVLYDETRNSGTRPHGFMADLSSCSVSEPRVHQRDSL